METDVKQQTEFDSTTATESKPPEKKLSKAEQKIAAKQMEFAQRASRESEKIKNLLCGKFREFFVTCDNPEGEEVREKIRQLHGQWIVHCKSWNLIPIHFHDVKKHCEFIVNEYKKAKLDNEVPPEENNSTKKLVE